MKYDIIDPLTRTLRYNEFDIVNTTKQEVELAIQEKLTECEHWNNTHKVQTFFLNTMQFSDEEQLGNAFQRCYIKVLWN